jgi:hypothetical protein
MWQVDTHLVVNMGTLVQLLLSFSYFKSLFSFTKLYCVSFCFVCFVLFRFVSFHLFSLKRHFRETQNFSKCSLFSWNYATRFVSVSQNEIPLKTLYWTRWWQTLQGQDGWQDIINYSQPPQAAFRVSLPSCGHAPPQERKTPIGSCNEPSPLHRGVSK